jgi:hypothetical protein
MVYTITVHMTAKSDPECIRKLKNKLIEASRIYSQDQETVSSFSMSTWATWSLVLRSPHTGLMVRDAERLRQPRVHDRRAV